MLRAPSGAEGTELLLGSAVSVLLRGWSSGGAKMKVNVSTGLSYFWGI